MKTLVHFLIALWCIFLSSPLAAQQDTSTLTGWFRWAHEPLDKAEVLSGILIQQTPIFIWPGIYDGVHVHDTLALSRSQWESFT